MKSNILFDYDCPDDDDFGMTISNDDQQLQIRIFDMEVATMTFDSNESNLKIVEQMADSLKEWVRSKREEIENGK